MAGVATDAERAARQSDGKRHYSAANRERKRAEILAAATRAMNAHGVQGLVLAEVAAEVGMTKANLTYYFRRKEDLAALCVEQTLDAYQGMIAAAGTQAAARDRLLALFERFFERAARVQAGEAPPLLVLSSLRALDEPYGAAAIARYGEMLRAAAALLDAADAPRLDPVDRLTRAQLILTHLFWAAAWLRLCDPGDYPRIAHRLHDIVANGLSPATSPSIRNAGATFTPPASDAEGERAAFYQAATRLINRLGYRGASIDRIGAALSVTKGAVYHHHSSKDELVLACSERSFASMWAIIRGIEALPGDPWRRLGALVDALVTFQTGNRGPFLRASVLNALPAALRDAMATQWARIINHFAALVSDGIAEGALRPVDPYLAAQVVAAGINAADEIRGFLPPGHPGDMARLCVEPTLLGVFCPAPRDA